MTVAAGGEYDDSEGYFVRPTVLLSDDPTDEAFSTEYFGPILAVHVYPDDGFDDMLDVVDDGPKYALTGAVIADDRAAVLRPPSDCATPQATSTSTTSRPERWWASSRSAVRGRRAPTTRQARR